MDTVFIIAGIAFSLLFIIALGLKIKADPYPPFEKKPKPATTLPLPADLPAPVERFYRAEYGEQIPIITSAVLSGRGSMAPFGLHFPIRFRFIYEVGKNYRAMFAGTFFRLPWMKADETYVDGHALGKMPTGIDEGSWFDEAMNLRVYCEMLHWFPAALLNAPGVCWEPVDCDTALLVVPFAGKQQRIVVRFDPGTAKVQYFEAMKYRSAKSKVLWVNGIWFDQGKPWIFMEIEEKLFNVPVHEAIVEGRQAN